jgi:peptide/nickel transport system substrate-binding protein
MRQLVLFIAMLFTSLSPATAQELRIGVQSEITSVDPHFQNYGPNNSMSRNIFEALIHFDKDDNMLPGLAESWKSLSDTTWEFKLRKGVKFHDGADFTADDVLFSMERIRNMQRSPNPFTTFIANRIVEKIDEHTVRFINREADPLLINYLPQLAISSAKVGQNASLEDFNQGRAAIGTGPYRFVRWMPGDRIMLERHEGYWGPKPDFQRVTFRPLPNDVARVASLLAGDVDIIENIPTADVKGLRSDPKMTVSSALSVRMMYLHLDRHREVSPHITAKDGSPIPNPLHNLKVRQALSAAINRPAIVERLMENEAEPAAQFLAPRYPGSSQKLKPTPLDLNRARALLTEAGYPNGFKITLHGPVNRYPNDAKVLEAIAQMFTRAGLEVKVETLPPSNFFTRASTGGPGGVPEFSVIFAGGGTASAEPASALIPLILTNDRSKGTGVANRGRYSNPKVDDLVLRAVKVMDDTQRNAMLAEATEIAFEDLGMIPLYFVNNTWASRKPIIIEGRADEHTMAQGAKRQ